MSDGKMKANIKMEAGKKQNFQLRKASKRQLILFYYVIKRKHGVVFFLFFFLSIRPKEFVACAMNSFTEAPTYFRATLSKNNLLHQSWDIFSVFCQESN